MSDCRRLVLSLLLAAVAATGCGVGDLAANKTSHFNADGELVQLFD